MKRISRLISISAITLLVLTTACNLPAQPAIATLPATEQITDTPLVLSTAITETPAPAIPITGMDVVSLQCQFCVNDEAHAVLLMSSRTFFNVADPNTGVTCLNAQEVNGRRILLCRGAQNASFTLNVCIDTANCLQFPITLQPCPLKPAVGTGTPLVTSTFAPLTPVILTPRNTLNPPTSVPATTTPATPVPTNTGALTPPPTSSTQPTTEPPAEPTATTEPEETEPPPPTTSATSGEGGDDGKLVICHISPGNSNQRTTLTVPRSAWENEHIRHGDLLGPCLYSANL